MFMLSFAIWLVVNIWAASFVSRKVEDADNRIAYYALIWCIPLFGAIAATTIAAHRTLRKDEGSSGRMLNSIAEIKERSRD